MTSAKPSTRMGTNDWKTGYTLNKQMKSLKRELKEATKLCQNTKKENQNLKRKIALEQGEEC